MTARFCISMEPLGILCGCDSGQECPGILLCSVPVARDPRCPGGIRNGHGLKRLSISPVHVNTLTRQSVGNHNLFYNSVAKPVAFSGLVCRDERRGGGGTDCIHEILL